MKQKCQQKLIDLLAIAIKLDNMHHLGHFTLNLSLMMIFNISAEISAVSRWSTKR